MCKLVEFLGGRINEMTQNILFMTYTLKSVSYTIGFDAKIMKCLVPRKVQKDGVTT